ncbi:hypothetical protein CCUS01_07365 [Colletotrichum cuscutae]|uniref:Uncharacterized protein n=1 Tax=Colletotrichum cuscutae TaxID=1209917 RepID=A0AAI9UXW1_9PEZI|nr:hypothetical protein CCUS01_07365 [Colletotrichum cuscutae]
MEVEGKDFHWTLGAFQIRVEPYTSGLTIVRQEGLKAYGYLRRWRGLETSFHGSMAEAWEKEGTYRTDTHGRYLTSRHSALSSQAPQAVASGSAPGPLHGFFFSSIFSLPADGSPGYETLPLGNPFFSFSSASLPWETAGIRKGFLDAWYPYHPQDAAATASPQRVDGSNIQRDTGLMASLLDPVPKAAQRPAPGAPVHGCTAHHRPPRGPLLRDSGTQGRWVTTEHENHFQTRAFWRPPPITGEQDQDQTTKGLALLRIKHVNPFGATDTTESTGYGVPSRRPDGKPSTPASTPVPSEGLLTFRADGKMERAPHAPDASTDRA